MKNLNYLFFLLLLFSVSLNAQNKKVTIQVKDVKNKPVAGAVILFDNVRQKSWTNSKGTYKAKLEKVPKFISAFSPKLGIKKVKYNGGDKVVIIIKEKNDIEVVGSNNQKSINTIQYRDFYDYLRGQVPGVNVVGGTINIRGYNSVNGSTTPLFVLNNSAVDQSVISEIVPTTIKSVTVLKGPETASYGSRGANGVIIVKTF